MKRKNSDTECILDDVEEVVECGSDENDHFTYGDGDEENKKMNTISSKQKPPMSTTENSFSDENIHITIDSDKNRRDVGKNVSSDNGNTIVVVGSSKDGQDQNRDNEEKESNDFEIIKMPEDSEMDPVANDDDDEDEDENQILTNVTLDKSWYKYPLILSSLIGRQDISNNNWGGGKTKEKVMEESKRVVKRGGKTLKCELTCYRVFVFAFIVFVWLLKFSDVSRLGLVILEKKFPFTVLDNLIWELRWVLTFALCAHMMSSSRFRLQEFLAALQITRKQWRRNARKMRFYVALVVLITIVAPVVMVMLDINWLNLNKIDQDADEDDSNQRRNGHLLENVGVALCILLYRLMLTPGFCLLSAMLYLLGDHIKTAGKRYMSFILF